VLIQRNPAARGGRAACGKGDREESVRAQTPFVWRPVEFEKTRIYGSLIGGPDPNHRGSNHGIDVSYCRADT
jgi:hypothetical protein